MATLGIPSRNPHASIFHFGICGGVSLCAFVLAMAVCLLHGDFSAIPALLGLAAMTLVASSVTPPDAGSNGGRPAGGRSSGAGQAKRRPMPALHRHCLEQ